LSEPTKANLLYRLTEDQYAQLERQLPQPVISAHTTDLQAGHLLGIQQVLNILRKGFVVQS